MTSPIGGQLWIGLIAAVTQSFLWSLSLFRRIKLGCIWARIKQVSILIRIYVERDINQVSANAWLHFVDGGTQWHNWLSLTCLPLRQHTWFSGITLPKQHWLIAELYNDGIEGSTLDYWRDIIDHVHSNHNYETTLILSPFIIYHSCMAYCRNSYQQPLWEHWAFVSVLAYSSSHPRRRLLNSLFVFTLSDYKT